MREIKFRAINSNGEMIYGLPYTDGVNDTLYYKDFNNRLCWRDEKGAHCNQPYKNGTLMQYTGFKDKNGKEIYDGDILSKKWVVEWEDERGFWVIFNPALHYCALGEGLYAVPELEVVGNIYENMELWETDKE